MCSPIPGAPGYNRNARSSDDTVVRPRAASMRTLSAIVGLLTLSTILALPRSASADRGTRLRRSAIPSGGAWYCYSFHDKYDIKDRASSCYRTKRKCRNARKDLEEDLNSGISAYDFQPCSEQARAAVYTWYDVMHDAWFYNASAAMNDCVGARKLGAKKPLDHKHLSSCRPVGRIKPHNPSHFMNRVVPEGKDWSCFQVIYGDLLWSACLRSHASCIGSRIKAEESKRYKDVGVCRHQDTVAAFTYFKTGTDDGGWHIITSQTQAVCYRRRAAIADKDGVLYVSACHEVGKK